MTTETSAPAAVNNVKMIIGGEQVDAADGQTFDVLNPATGEVIARAPLGGPEDVNRAVQAAQAAPHWHLGPGDRQIVQSTTTS